MGEGDALDFPFCNGYFDAITMGYGLRNVVDKCRAMQEIFQVYRLYSIFLFSLIIMFSFLIKLYP